MRLSASVSLLLVLVVMLPLAHSLISINKAGAIAQSAIHTPISPSSNPGIPSIVDNTTYYVIEFGDVWVPVNADTGEAVTEYKDDAFNAVYLHQFAQLVISAKKNDGYPTKLINSLIVLQGNVETKMIYYKTYLPQMPDNLKPKLAQALNDMKALDNAINRTINDIDKLKKIDDYILSVSISSQNETDWRHTFSQVLNDMSDVVMKGYAFDNSRGNFVSDAAKFVQNDSEDIQKRSLVANFIADCGVDGIPTTLPNYKNIVSNWNSWLSSVLSKSVVENKSRQKYLSSLDTFNQIKAKDLKIKAYTKVSAVKTGFEGIKAQIGGCVDQLPTLYKKKYHDAEVYYNRSLSAYNEGSLYLNQSNYTLAVLRFEDAMGWAEKLGPLITQLSKANCPKPVPEQTQQNGIIGIIQRNWIAIVSFLIIVLGVVYFFQNRPGKGRKQIEEYSPSYGEGSTDIGGYDIGDLGSTTDISDLFDGE